MHNRLLPLVLASFSRRTGCDILFSRRGLLFLAFRWRVLCEFFFQFGFGG
jgi:hypothetical protein